MANDFKLLKSLFQLSGSCLPLWLYHCFGSICVLFSLALQNTAWGGLREEYCYPFNTLFIIKMET